MTSAQHKSFGSDNHAGAHPAILSAVLAANAGDATAYGDDPLTARALSRLGETFGAAGAFLVFGGTAANVLGLSLLLRPFEAVICADSAHLHNHEGGAPERVLGSKLLTVTAPDGKLTPKLIATRLADRGDPHRAQPRAVEIAQATEVGTCYTLGELREIREFCDAHDLRLHMDGARLANAAAHLGCGLADLARYADVLSFGGTKNGALGAEAVIVMSEPLVAAVPYQRMQLMQLASKMRFLAAQFNALLDDDLWLRNATQANRMARRLADGLTDVPELRLAYPAEANMVFPVLPAAQASQLQLGWNFHTWADLDNGRCVSRWMTAFDTTEADVDAFLADIQQAARHAYPAA